MEGFERHLFQQDRKRVLAAIAELTIEPYRAVPAPLTPAPGAKDYSSLSRAVALVSRVDETRAKAEAWEAQNPLPAASKIILDRA